MARRRTLSNTMRSPLENRQVYLELQDEIRKSKNYYTYIRQYVKIPEDLAEQVLIREIDKFFDYEGY